MFNKTKNIHFITILALAGLGIGASIFGAKSTETLVVLVLVFGILAGLSLIKITKEHQTKNILKEKEEAFSSILENIKDGVLLYDTEFKVTSLNKSAEEMLRVTKSQIVGKTISPRSVEDPSLSLLAKIIFPSLSEKTSYESDAGWPQIVRISFLDPKMEVLTYLYEIKKEDGSVIGFLKLIQNETREKGLVQSKNEFVSVAAHQLRTPLTGIHWAFETLLQALPADADIKKIAEEGFSLAERSLKIINDLLDTAKLEEGNFGYSFEKRDIIEFLSGLITATNNIAKQFNVSVVSKLQKEKVIIKMDPNRLSMALGNIIDNAIRYNNEHGTVIISSEQEGSTIKIMIEDTGIGIPEKEKEKLFQKFYRGEKAIGLQPNGSGLGLYITKNIISQHGGSIRVDSIEKRGTTFTITLPVVEDPNPFGETK